MHIRGNTLYICIVIIPSLLKSVQYSKEWSNDIVTVKEMKLDLGTQSFMQNTKHVYNLQPNYIQCSNAKNYGVKVSLFLFGVRVSDL